MPRSLRELTSAIASGDTEAFAVLYRERFDMMYAEARRLTRRDESFCLDVVQDAMLKVIRAMKPFDDEQSLLAWLRTIVKRCAYDRLRAEVRRRRRELRSARPEAVAAGDDADANRLEHLEWLGRQLHQLNGDQHRLLSLRFGLGWTLQQIGVALRLKPGAVDGRINRTLALLRRSVPDSDSQSAPLAAPAPGSPAAGLHTELELGIGETS